MKKKSKPALLCVQILEAKPNKLFSEQMRESVRFLRYNQHVPCAACGKKLRVHWTMLCQFKAGDMSKTQFTMQFYPQGFPPLTPVCGDHPLRPDWPVKKTTKQKG